MRIGGYGLRYEEGDDYQIDYLEVCNRADSFAFLSICDRMFVRFAINVKCRINFLGFR